MTDKFYDNIQLFSGGGYVVDFEALTGKTGDYVIKELSVASIISGGTNVKTFTFKAPYSWEELSPKTRQSNQWLIVNRHYCEWESGKLDYNCIPNVLECISKSQKIFAKGLQKAQFLSGLIGKHVHELGQMGCPKVSKVSSLFCLSDCPHHSITITTTECAAIKASIFARWCLTQWASSKLEPKPKSNQQDEFWEQDEFWDNEWAPGPKPIKEEEYWDSEWAPGPKPVKEEEYWDSEWAPGPKPIKEEEYWDSEWAPGPKPIKEEKYWDS